VRAPLAAFGLALVWWTLYARIDVLILDVRHGMPRKLGPEVLFPFAWILGIACALTQLDWRPPRRFAVTMLVLVLAPPALVFTPLPRWIATMLA
jgi:hypothetical protein